MAGDFDPYHKWLGIPQKDQPPHHYRLLSLELFEDDPEVIESAADRQMAHVRTFQSGAYSALSQKLLNELAAAKLCLLNSDQKARYDQALRAQLGVVTQSAAPTSAAPRPAKELPVEGGTSVILTARPASQPPGANLVLKAIPLRPATPEQTALRPALPLNASYRRALPIWRQPLVLAGGGAAMTLAVIVLALLAARRQHAVAIAPEPSFAAEAAEAEPLTGVLTEASAAVIGQSAAPPLEAAPAAQPQPSAPPAASPRQLPTASSEAARAASSLLAPAQSPPAKPTAAAMPAEARPASPAPQFQTTAAAGKSLDLLKCIVLDDHTLSGLLEWVDGALTGVDVRAGGRQAANGNCQVQVPFHPGDHEYLLTMVIEPVTSTAALDLGLISSGRQFVVVFLGQRCYLSQLDGQHLNSATNWPAEIFAGGKAATLTFAVGRNELRVSVDGRPVVHWTEYHRLSRQQEWNGPDPQALSIGWNLGNIRILKLEAASLRDDSDPGWLQAAVVPPPKPVPVESIDLATAIQEIETRGGRLQRDEGAPGKPVTAASFYNGVASNDLIPYLAAIPTLRRITLSGSPRFTGRGLEALARLNLESLDVSGTSVRAANLAPLMQMKSLTSLNLSRTPIGDDALAGLRSLDQLRQLHLSGAAVTDAGMEYVAGVQSLEILDLSDTAVGNAGLARLKTLARLRHFNLSRTNVTDEGLVALEGMSELQSLQLPETLDGSGLRSLESAVKLQRVTLGGPRLQGDSLASLAKSQRLNSLWIQNAPLGDDDLAPLAGMRQLRDLSLQRTQVAGPGLRHLARLPELRSLTLSGKQITDDSIPPATSLVRLNALTLIDTSVTGAGLAGLGRLKELTMLNLGSSPIDDNVLARLKPLKKLQNLYLYSTNVTDAGLTHLKTLSELQYVGLNGAKTTEAGVEALRKALPKAKIQR